MAVLHWWQEVVVRSWLEVTHCYEQVCFQWWQGVVVRSWLEVTHCYQQMWVQWWQEVVHDEVPEGHLQIEVFQEFQVGD